MKKSVIGILLGLACFAAGVMTALWMPAAMASGARDEAPSHVTVVPGPEPYQFHIVVVQGDRLYVQNYPQSGETPLELKPLGVLKK